VPEMVLPPAFDDQSVKKWSLAEVTVSCGPATIQRFLQMRGRELLGDPWPVVIANLHHPAMAKECPNWALWQTGGGEYQGICWYYNEQGEPEVSISFPKELAPGRWVAVCPP